MIWTLITSQKKNFEVLKTIGESIQRAFYWEENRWYGFQIAFTSPLLVPKSGKTFFYNADQVNSQQGTLSTKPEIRSAEGTGFEVEVSNLDDFFEKQLIQGDPHANSQILLLKYQYKCTENKDKIYNISIILLLNIQPKYINM